MITARNRNLRGTSFKLTHREGKLKLTPCKLVRDGDSEINVYNQVFANQQLS